MQHLVKRAIVVAAILLVVACVVVGNRVASERRLDHQLASAKRAIDNREFQTASARLDEYLEQRPDNLDVRLLAAQTARRQRDFDKARKHLRAHEERNGPPEARNREQQLLIVQEDSSSDGKALLDQCLSSDPPENLELALEVAIGRQQLMIERGFNDGKSLVEGPFGTAVQRTGEAISIWLQRRPHRADQVQGLIWRGKISLLINQEQAVAEFRQALALDPTHIDARVNLAIALVEFDAREATEHLELIHRRLPQNHDVSVLLASFHKNVGKLPQAIELLEHVLQNNPNHAAAILERSKAAMDIGEYRDAERYLRLALVESPKEPFLHLALSRCLLRLGNEPAARQHEQKYTELQSEVIKSQATQSEAEREWRKKMERQLKPHSIKAPTR